MAESRNRADQDEPDGRKGTPQSPSPHADTDAASGRTRDRNRKPARRGRSAKRNALVERVRGYRQFFEAVAALDPPLSPGAVAVWCWLWTCTRKGQAKYTVRRLAERFGVVPSTVSRWVGELTNAGFVETVRRGKPGRSATIVRVRHSPNTKPDGQP
jgi:DNA-binding transcriptional ArsR family regulator